MTDPQELRRNAEDCLKQVRIATSARDKVLLLDIAYAWLKLCEQVQQLRASPRHASTLESQGLHAHSGPQQRYGGYGGSGSVKT